MKASTSVSTKVEQAPSDAHAEPADLLEWAKRASAALIKARTAAISITTLAELTIDGEMAERGFDVVSVMEAVKACTQRIDSAMSGIHYTPPTVEDMERALDPILPRIVSGREKAAA